MLDKLEEKIVSLIDDETSIKTEDKDNMKLLITEMNKVAMLGNKKKEGQPMPKTYTMPKKVKKLMGIEYEEFKPGKDDEEEDDDDLFEDQLSYDDAGVTDTDSASSTSTSSSE